MEGCGENMYMHAQMATMRKLSDIQREYSEQVRNMWKYGLMWNKLGVTLAESHLNALMQGIARWSDAGMFYQKNVLDAFQPHEQRKIDSMVMEILKRT